MATTQTVESIGRVSNASVLKCTGKSWDKWIAILERIGAKNLSHQEIVALLKKKYKLNQWWQQGVTRGYEIHIGRTVEGRSAKGFYSTVATRTFPIDNKSAWKLITSPEGLSCWLRPISKVTFKKGATYAAEGEVFGEIRTLKAPQRARLTWQEPEWERPSIVQVYIVPRQNKKCVVVFQHDQLSSGRLRLEMRDRWKLALNDLAQIALV